MLGQNHLDFEKLSYLTAFMQKNEKNTVFHRLKIFGKLISSEDEK